MSRSFGPTLLGLRTTRTVLVKNTNAVSAQVSSAMFDAVATPIVAGSVSTQLQVSLVTGPVATAPASSSGVKATPTVSAVSPATGPTAGGTTVTITGSNVQPVTAVLFGTKRVAATCTATSCTVVSPRDAGRVDVRVVTPSGTSAVVAADRFTYR